MPGTDKVKNKLQYIKKWTENAHKYGFWDTEASRKVQKKEARVILQWLYETDKPFLDIVEVGCGNGYLASLICNELETRNTSYSYCLTDLVPECIDFAKKQYPSFNAKRVTFKVSDVYKLDQEFGKGSLGCIVSTGYASAVTYPEAVPVVARALKPNGILICDFVNHASWFSIALNPFTSFIRAVDFMRGKSTSSYHFGRWGIEAFFLKYKLKLLKSTTVGLRFNPLLCQFVKVK